MSEAITKAAEMALEALRSLHTWDACRNYVIPYRVRDPIQDAETALRAALSQAGQGGQGEAVYWEWRHQGSHPQAMDFGQWSEWSRVEPRTRLHTVEDSLQEFRAYIASGYKYELRALYAAQPAPVPAVPMPTTEDEAAAMQMLGQAWLEQNAPHRLKPAPAPADQEAAHWCAYVGGMVAHWVKSEPDAHARLGDDDFEAAIAGIIERRMWALKREPAAALPVEPTQAMITAAQSAYWPGVQVPSVHCITRALKAALSAAPKPDQAKREGAAP